MIETQKIWEPTKRQADFLSLPDSIFDALFGGAAGSGKSETLLMLPIVRQFHLHPRFKGLLLRRTYPELESEIIVRSKEFYGECGAKYNDTKKRWTFPSGAIIQFGHCENEQDVTKYDTTQYNYMAFDELTSFTEYQYIYLSFSRVRSSDNRLPAIVRSGTNPGGIGHSWCLERFVAPCLDGYKIIRRQVKFTLDGKLTNRYVDSIFIPAKATDNPHLLEANPDYLTRLASLPPAEKAAKLEGSWSSFEGQAFVEFRRDIHVVSPFQVPEYWARVLAIDWGYTAMMCAGWYAINPVPDERFKAKIYKYRERTAFKTSVAAWSTDLARDSDGEALVDIVLDPSAWQERGQGLIADLFAQNFGRQANRANNDRIGGKSLLQEYIRVTPRPPRYIPKEGFNLDTAMRIKRMVSDKAYDDYKKLFEPETPEDFLPKFQIFENCVETIKVIPRCSYAPNTKGKPSEDVGEFVGDDPYDETRYGLEACQQYLDNGVSVYRKEQEVAKIVLALETTGSMTDYYRKMDIIERKEQQSERNTGISFFRRHRR